MSMTETPARRALAAAKTAATKTAAKATKPEKKDAKPDAAKQAAHKDGKTRVFGEFDKFERVEVYMTAGEITKLEARAEVLEKSRAWLGGRIIADAMRTTKEAAKAAAKQSKK